MKTRYSSLVTVKKSSMESSENALKQANLDYSNAQSALEQSYELLNEVSPPGSGSVADMLASRTLMSSQRGVIQHNQEWMRFAKEQVELAQKKLKSDMIEYEKFKYLELEEIKKALKAQKLQEAKDLDEVALMTHSKMNLRRKD